MVVTGLWSTAHGYHRGHHRTWQEEAKELSRGTYSCVATNDWPRWIWFACGTEPSTSSLCKSSILLFSCIEVGEGPSRGEEMRRVSSRLLLLSGCLLVLAVIEAECFSQPGTTYRVSHCQMYQAISQPAHRCCPGWRRVSGRAWLGCNTALCQPPCQNGGKCSRPNQCACPAGWTGRCCQTDVDECAGGRHGCSQACLNVAGSYSCSCQKGHKLQADGKTCQAPALGITGLAGASNLTVQEDVKELRTRVLALEEKLQQALAPFLSLEPPGPESASSNGNTLRWLLHVWQQVDRIDSLSEQISFLEEQLETCSCQPGEGGRRSRKRSPPF